jgi:ribonuclease-3
VADIAVLQKTLGVNFTDTTLLEQALVHSSYINENPGIVAGHNERLEFLGDSVLDIIVTEKLYQENPDLSEGEMTKLRAALVRRDTLARVARSINLGDFFYMGRGEESSGGRNKPANLAGAMEALIASIYLDRGMATTRAVVLKLLENEWAKAFEDGTGADYKSRLQEYLQSKYQQTPVYRLVEESGPDHDKSFTVEVTTDTGVLARGKGKSKKLAEKEAARMALEQFDADFTR